MLYNRPYFVGKELMTTKVSLHFPNYKKRKIHKEDIVDLEKFSFKSFNAEQFFKEGIIAKRVYKDSITTGIKYNRYDNIPENEEFLTIYRKKLKFGNFIKYHQLTFPTMKVLTDSNRETMAIYAKTIPLSLKELVSFSDYLDVKLGKGISSRYQFKWKDGDKIVRFSILILKANQSNYIGELIITKTKFVDKLHKIKSDGEFSHFKYEPLEKIEREASKGLQNLEN